MLLRRASCCPVISRTYTPTACPPFLLLQYLGVRQLSKLAVVSRHVLPRAAELPPAAVAAVLLPVFKQLSAAPEASQSGGLRGGPPVLGPAEL